MAKPAQGKRKAAAAGGGYEGIREPLAPRAVFIRRLRYNGLLALAMIAVSLAIGMAGYAGFAGMGWVDAFENAAMILSGMGPARELTSDGAKIFAGLYSLYSGLALVATAGLILAPILHRFMHRFHLEDSADET
jgi:hypothetical protein